MRVLIIMFLCHFVADFLLQSREMGKTKSTKFNVLVTHVMIQFLVMVMGLLFVAPLDVAYTVAGLNMIVHGVIDWYIWRLYKWSAYKRMTQYDGSRLRHRSTGVWQYWEDHWFYATIGLDQLLHSLTLIILAGVLT